MIEVSNLVKTFGPITAVNDVSFRVEKGDVLAFLGPNGAGKSTTMRMITGYLRQDSGTVRVDGHDVLAEPAAAKAKIGYLPESAPLYDEMKVTAFLKFAAGMRGLRGRAGRAAIDRAIELCHLNGVARQSIGTLSKGYRHRTCFAQALLHDPDVLILDEPTDGLDPNQKHEMRQLIKRMGQDKAIVVSTHILEEVHAACSRVAILNRGELVFNGTPEQLEAKAANHGAMILVLNGRVPKHFVERLYTAPEADKIDVLEDGTERLRLRLFSKTGNTAAFTEQIADLCHSSSWQVHEMRLETGRLDEVFRELTLGAE